MRIKFLSVIVSFLAISFAMSSCLDNDNTIEYGTDPTIQSFSINDINTDSIIKNGNYNGTEDTTIVIKLTGSDYPFTIDQLASGSYKYDNGEKDGIYTGMIFNKDSLPVGTNIKKVVVNMSLNGYILYYPKDINGKDSLSMWNSTDSLDFSSPVYFSVYAQDPALQNSPKIYQVKINVHQQYPDSLEWKQMPESNFEVTGAQKAVLFNNNIFVYSANAAYQGNITSEKQITWDELTLSGFPAQVPTSLVVFNDNLYATINGSSEYYVSNNGKEWSKHSFTEGTIETLLGVSKNQLLAVAEKDGNKYSYIMSATGEWKQKEELPKDFPTTGVASVSYPLKHNSTIEKTIILSNDPLADNDNAVCWGLLSNNEKWTQYSPNSESSYKCPRLDNLALIYYNNELYAFGGKGDNAFKAFYTSKDEGITWKEAISNISIPASFKEKNKNNDFSYIVDKDNFIWIMWSNSGEVWRGRINKLGFVN